MKSDLTRGNGLIGAEELNTSRTNAGGVVNTFPFSGCDIYKDVFAFCAALKNNYELSN